jgi:hypothetical protein
LPAKTEKTGKKAGCKPCVNKGIERFAALSEMGEGLFFE